MHKTEDFYECRIQCRAQKVLNPWKELVHIHFEPAVVGAFREIVSMET